MSAEKNMRTAAEASLARAISSKGNLERFLEGVLRVRRAKMEGWGGWGGAGIVVLFGLVFCRGCVFRCRGRPYRVRYVERARLQRCRLAMWLLFSNSLTCFFLFFLLEECIAGRVARVPRGRKSRPKIPCRFIPLQSY